MKIWSRLSFYIIVAGSSKINFKSKIVGGFGCAMRFIMSARADIVIAMSQLTHSLTRNYALGTAK
jgi:hypothetical protein